MYVANLWQMGQMMAGRTGTEPAENFYCLQTAILGVTFEDHPLFIRQNSIGAEIRRQMQLYEDRSRYDPSSNTRTKLQVGPRLVPNRLVVCFRMR